MTTIKPAQVALRGDVRVPGDKSVSHRAAMFAALCDGPVEIHNYGPGADNHSTLGVLRDLGVSIEGAGTDITVHGQSAFKEPTQPLDCGNSGTTMRLMAGWLAGQSVSAVLVGDESLTSRPMARIADPLNQRGCNVRTTDGRPPMKVGLSDGFEGGVFESRVASAQVKSALLLAALGHGVSLRVEEPAASRDHTEVLLRYLGVNVVSSTHYQSTEVPGVASVELPAYRLPLRAAPITVPGDISSAAFLMVAAAIVPDSSVTLSACGVSVTRAGVLEVLKETGIDFELRSPRKLECGEPVADIVVRQAPLEAFSLGGALVPRVIDEIPVLAVLAGRAHGTTVFKDVGELKVKESDRLAKTVELLQKCGCTVEAGDDWFSVTGREEAFSAFEYHAEHDHRMAAAAAVAALVADGPCQIEGMDCLAISYPHLMEDIYTLMDTEKE